MPSFEVVLTARDLRPMATRVLVRFFVILYVATFIAMSVFRLTHPPTDGSDTFIIILIYAVGCAIGFAIFVPLVENKTAIIIRLRGRAQYLIVPKRCLSEAEQTELVTILRDKLGN